jgi:hypothetical protein
MSAFDERSSAGTCGIDQPERAVTHSADDLVGGIRFGDLARKS